MPERLQGGIEPFKVSQGPSTEHDKKPGKVPVKFKLSSERNIGQPDPLVDVLTAPPREEVKDTMHFVKRGVESRGHHYQPEAWGRMRGRPPISGTKATGMGSHTSKPGGNPLGSNSNRKGDNPLGHAMNRVGTNVLGRPGNKVGSNPLGRNSNRMGEKSGYRRFSPQGGGRRP